MILGALKPYLDKINNLKTVQMFGINIMKKILFLLLAFCGSQSLLAHGISDSDKQTMIEGGYLEYISLGASHMITGYDHLLFLFGVIFFLTKFKDIVKFITAFTLGHCITLIFATFMGISANYYLVDAVIALTVIYKGFDNLDGFKKVFKRESPNLLVLVFVFGLIHGFGLSTRLQQLPLGEEGLLLKIFSFNLGVEFGQIAALAIMLVGLNIWRKKKSFAKFSKASNIALILAGLGLFIMQIHGYVNQQDHTSKHSEAEVVPVVKPALNEETIEITIPGNSSLEYKFLIEADTDFEYSWETGGVALFYDFHGDPIPSQNGYFKSYEKSTKSESTGTIKTPFKGSHGWYWKNKTSKDVIVSLKTKGQYKVLGIR